MFIRWKDLPEIKATKSDSDNVWQPPWLLAGDQTSAACLLASRKASGLVFLQIIVFNERMKLLSSKGLEAVVWQYCRTFKGISWNFQGKAPKLETEKGNVSKVPKI